jgi:uncharacterized membrane protein YoaK (UPF0700 family)
MLDKVKEAEEFLRSQNKEGKDEFLKYMDRWIAWFQHERLVHLLVTLFFALFALSVVYMFVFTQDIVWFVLFLLFGITTGFYVNHYYLLENKTQYLYELYDKIEKL